MLVERLKDEFVGREGKSRTRNAMDKDTGQEREREEANQR